MYASSPATPLTRIFAWLGGLSFVASLLYGVHFYLVRLGQNVGVSQVAFWPSIVTNLALFGLFALHHSLTARESVKAWITRVVPPVLERTTYVWISSVLFYAVCRFWAPVPGPAFYQATGPMAWLGIAVQAGGVWLIVRASRALDILSLAGIRQATGAVAAASFLVDGPYRWIRHPVYLGWILLVFGAPHMTPGRLVFAAISSGYLLVAIPWEERSLLRTFGDRYREYLSQVPWKLLPYVY